MKVQAVRVERAYMEALAKQPKPQGYRTESVLAVVIGRTAKEREEWKTWWRLALTARGFDPEEAPLFLETKSRDFTKGKAAHVGNRRALDRFPIEDPEWKDDLRYEGGPKLPLGDPGPITKKNHNAMLRVLLGNSED